MIKLFDDSLFIKEQKLKGKNNNYTTNSYFYRLVYCDDVIHLIIEIIDRVDICRHLFFF